MSILDVRAVIHHSDGSQKWAKYPTCTVAMNGTGFCDAPVPKDSPISLCRTHLAAAYLYCTDKMAEQDEDRQLRIERQREQHGERQREAMRAARTEAALVDDPNSAVYYIRFSDRIKIGYTRNLRERLQAIPHDAVMALEPGGRQVEALRHRQFAEHRLTGEWFAPHPDLMAHIAAIPDYWAFLR